MKIETKFNTNQSVFVLFKNEIRESKISNVYVNVSIKTDIIDYYVERYTDIVSVSYMLNLSGTDIFKEDRLFNTKEELLKSL